MRKSGKKKQYFEGNFKIGPLTVTWLFASVTVVNSGNTINWIIERPIVFGQNAILFCNASAVENCCSNTVTWMRDYDVIVHHGASANSRKYVQRQENDGFSLIIKYFNVNDINYQYTCLYDFYSYSRTLELNKEDFQRLPKHEEIKSELIQRKEDIFSKVTFEEVYPIPKCILMLNDKEAMSSNISVTQKKIGQFYHATIELVCEINSSFCDGNITSECWFGERKMMIDSKDISVDCLSTVPVTYNGNILLIGVGFAVLLIVSVSVCIAKRRNIRHLCAEDGDTSRWPRFCPLNCHKYSVESELIPLLANNAEGFQYQHITGEKVSGKIPAQRPKDIMRIIKHDNDNSKVYHLQCITNEKINSKRDRKCDTSFDVRMPVKFCET